MLTIIDYQQREKSSGEKFNVLILQGGIELVKSQETGNFYATTRKVSIPSTLNEEACKSVLGQQVPGSIKKVDCDPYPFVHKETGEVTELNYKWVFVPEGATVEENIFQGEPA